MNYIKCSSTFTEIQDAFLKRIAEVTGLFSVEDISSYKRSCTDVAEVQRLIDFLYAYTITDQRNMKLLFEVDAKFIHLVSKLSGLIKGDI